MNSYHHSSGRQMNGRGGRGSGTGGRGTGNGRGTSSGGISYSIDNGQFQKKGISIHQLEKSISQCVNQMKLTHLDNLGEDSIYEQHWKIPHPKVEASPLTHPLYTLLGEIYKEDCEDAGIKHDSPPVIESRSSINKKSDQVKSQDDVDSKGIDKGIGEGFSYFTEPITLPSKLGCFGDKFYLYTNPCTKKEDTFGLLEAYWSIVCPESIVWSENSRQNLFKQLRMMMSLELSKFYSDKNYRLKGYRRSKMQENLLTTDPLISECLVYLSDFLDVNLYVIKPPHYYSLHDIVKSSDEENDNSLSIVVYYDDGQYYSLLHEDGKSHQLFKHKDLLTILESNFTSIAISDSVQGKKSNCLPKASELRKMKVAELRQYASTLEIPICGDHGKNRLKADILNDLLALVTT